MVLSTPPRALLFDVFGTCVDWRKSVVGTLQEQAQLSLNSATASLARPVKLKASSMTTSDWGLFAQQWRDGYKKFTQKLAEDPSLPWMSVDEHHLVSLRRLVIEWEIEGLWGDEELQNMSLVWHRLVPWDDSVAGIALLNQSFCMSLVATSSQEFTTDDLQILVRYLTET